MGQVLFVRCSKPYRKLSTLAQPKEDPCHPIGIYCGTTVGTGEGRNGIYKDPYRQYSRSHSPLRVGAIPAHDLQYQHPPIGTDFWVRIVPGQFCTPALRNRHRHWPQAEQTQHLFFLSVFWVFSGLQPKYTLFPKGSLAGSSAPRGETGAHRNYFSNDGQPNEWQWVQLQWVPPASSVCMGRMKGTCS